MRRRRAILRASEARRAVLQLRKSGGLVNLILFGILLSKRSLEIGAEQA
jgi:hypothetical protein